MSKKAIIIIISLLVLIITSTIFAQAEDQLKNARVYYDSSITEFDSLSTSQEYEVPLREIIKEFDVKVSDGEIFNYEANVDVPVENRYGNVSIGGQGYLKLSGELKYSNSGTPFVEGTLKYTAKVEDIDSTSEKVASTIWDVECIGDFKLVISKVSGEATLSYGGMFEDSDINTVIKTTNYKDGSQIVGESEEHNWFGVTYNFASEAEFESSDVASTTDGSEEKSNESPVEDKTDDSKQIQIPKVDDTDQTSALITTIIISIISSIIGVGVVASTQVEKSETNEEPSVKRVEHPNGVIELIYPNGTRKIKFPDGSSKEKWPDGTITGTASDGTTFEQKPNGPLEISLPNGDKVVEYPDGKVITTKSNGLVITENPDGTTEVYDSKFEEKVIHYPDGLRTFINDDGKVTTIDEDDNIIRIEQDGVIGQKQNDGTIEITYPDKKGKIIIDNDKSVSGTIVDNDGFEFSFDDNKSGILITTSEGAELVADNNGNIKGNLEDGSKISKKADSEFTKIEMEDGSYVKVDSKGNTIGKDAQTGYEFERNSDGSIELKDDNGNYYKEDKDGNCLIKTEDGWQGEISSNGQKRLKAPNGKEMTEANDGTVTINFEDGTVGKKYADNTVELVRPDGTTEKYVNNQVTIHHPDGSVERISMNEYESRLN